MREEERFSNLLERRLGEPVYNLAIGDNDLRDYQGLLAYAEANGARPRRLVLGICMGNDLRNYQLTEPASPQPRTLRLSWATQRLKRRSALFLAVWHHLHQNSRTRQWLAQARLTSPAALKHNYLPYDEAVLQSSRDEVLRIAQGREVVVLLVPSVGLWLPRDPATEQRILALFEERPEEAADLRARATTHSVPRH